MNFLLKTGAALALLAATPVSANIVSYDGTNYNPGDVIDISFTGQSGGLPVAGLSADLSLTFLSVDASGDYLFSWVLTDESRKRAFACFFFRVPGQCQLIPRSM